MGKDTFELAGREWPRVSWWKMKHMRGLYLYLWAAMLTSATNGECSPRDYSPSSPTQTDGTNSARTGYDGSLINSLQSMKQWRDYFHDPSPSILGLITASFSMGSMLAIPFVPYCADLLGRRAGVVIGCSIMIIGIVLLSLGVHIAVFIVGRLLLGFGIAIAHGSAPLLITELVHPQHRSVYTT